jgi:hypothetical protein
MKGFADGAITTIIDVNVSFADRVRLLISGRCLYKDQPVCGACRDPERLLGDAAGGEAEGAAVNDYRLTDGEKTTTTWVRLKAYLQYRLDTARLRNDGVLSEYETAALRGEIKCLKHLIGLDAVRPMTGDEE